MSTVSNIRVTNVSKFSVLTSENVEEAIQQLRNLLADTIITKNIYMELDGVEIDGIGAVENYTFIVVRRFTINGVLYVGGHNGEILNTDELFEAITKAAQY